MRFGPTRLPLLLPSLALAGGLVTPGVVWAADCGGTSTGAIPLMDLGPSTYQGFAGGLYSGGSNQRPVAHEAAGVAIAESIVPLDTLGQPDPDGRIVFVSIGMSNATQEFSTFVPLANADPAKHPQVRVIDCAQGGQATQDIRHPDAPYWDHVATRLRLLGSSPAQVQAVWIKEARRGPTGSFPASAESLAHDLGRIVRLLRDELPNVRLAYFTSRIYAGYATGTLNPEPYAYESGFAVRWLIEAQIAGADSLEFDPNEGPVEAPWLSWGPYLWADGLVPRSDGLTWACAEFANDGVHPDTAARRKVAQSLLAFMKSDPTAVPWFARATLPVPDAPRIAPLHLTVGPNPFYDELAVSFTVPHAGAWRLEALEVTGRRVAILGTGVAAGAHSVRWSAVDRDRNPLRAGVYWLRLVTGAHTVAERVVLLGR